MLKGEILIPSDKSISHRSLIIGSLTKSALKVSNFSMGADCRATMEIIKQLGAKITLQGSKNPKILVLDASGCYEQPKSPLDCQNSGTTMRIMSGILASQVPESTLTGDVSLSKRPMRRIIEPLRLMGAKIESVDGHAPLTIYGSKLKGINYLSPMSSAQVKSCLLLAGLNAKDSTTITEPEPSRDHTERMLKYFEADIKTEMSSVTISPKPLTAHDLEIPGDISSAAFFIVAASIIPNSEIIIKNVGLNPTRTGILDVMEKMGAKVEVLDKRLVSNEDVGDLKVSYSNDLAGIEISGKIIPRLIDELPIIAVLATQATGTTVIKDAQDLRNKESDRIGATVRELKKMGADIEETPDGFIINGKSLTGGCTTESYHDHRLAMSWFIASQVAKNPVNIEGLEWINTSFPEFFELYAKLST